MLIHCTRIAACCLSWTVAAATLAAEPIRQDWPAFRGPLRNGMSTSEQLPTTWSNEHNVRWRCEIPGNGWSSPVVVADTIYLTAAIPRSDAAQAAHDLVLVMLSASEGTIQKQVKLFSEPDDSPGIHKKNSPASATPVYDGERLFVHFGHQGTACTDLAGNVIWRNDTLGYTPIHGNGGSPAVVADMLIFSRDGGDISEVTALHKRTGEIAWQTQRNVEVNKHFSFCTPLVLRQPGQTQLILPGSNVVQSLDPANGNELWRVRYDGYSVVPRPIYSSGIVFVCTGFNKPSLLAIDPSGGGDVTDTHVKWQTDAAIPKTPSIVAYQDTVAMVSDDGIASCFDAQSGERLWRERIGGDFSASPLLAGSQLYLLSEKGDCTILDISGSTPVEVAKNSLGEATLASPAVIGNDLLVRTAAALYRIGNP